MSEPARDPSRTRPTTEPREETTEQLLGRVLAEVRKDAGVRPRSYARDTVVPEGGE